MKTFARLIRRYGFAAVGLGLLLPALCIGLLAWLGWQTGQYMPQWAYSSGAIADSMVSTADGLTFGAEHTPQEWMDGYAWAMALDDDGNVFWHYNLPDLLNRRYAPTDVARFAHWYLADYPVFCWTEDYGLFVIALPQGSLWKYNFYSAPAVITHLIHSILPVCFGLLAIGLAVCFALSWRSARRLRTVSAGLDALADGQPVRLPTEGFTAELAEKLNQTSAHLQKQSEIIARRDQARTRWIAGVSHDVRTPLALILGWAEQLEQDSALPEQIGGLYLPGGYPELYAGQLSTNRSMLASVRRAVERGLPTVAECGGFLYLGQSLEDASGERWPMAGVLPGQGFRVGRLVRFGYAALTAHADSMLFRAGERLPVHEFHHWDSTDNGTGFTAAKPNGKQWDCGFANEHFYAGFPHLYWAGTALPRRFVDAAAHYHQEEQDQ